MARHIFIRNIRARDNLEIFIISAVSSLLLLRFYLYLAGYPQVGGGTLHIAHMLWGGVLMLIAMVSNLAFLGEQVKRLTALVGGIGFGIFIDELGKLITKDNNYFFRPAVGIIYAIFVLLYVAISLIGRRTQLSSREYQLNALAQLEEAILRDFNPAEQQNVRQLVAQADQNSSVTHGLKQFLSGIETVQPAKPRLHQRIMVRFDAVYTHLWQRRSSNTAVQVLFLAQIAIFGSGVLYTLLSNADAVQDLLQGSVSYGRGLVFGQLIGTVIAAIFTVMGVIQLARSRAEAFEFFRRATLTNLLFTEFFIFSRIQFSAMPSFIFNLLLLLLINLALAQERRLSRQA